MIDAVDERARRVWKLHDGGMPMRDIAIATGIRISTVRAIILDVWREGVAHFRVRCRL